MGNGYNVLVVDDEPIVGRQLRSALLKDGFNVETFDVPAEALKRISEKEFDVVVTDVRMDDVDGIDVLEQALNKSSKTKVIMITGFAMMELARHAMEKGAFDFLAKPFTPNDLRAAIGKALAPAGL
ncbi:MAG: response regulator [Nitrospirae bacterium]|nr:response regulator [Nitrospirota bacterium]MBF0533493.1 response regulator [Nitrospirota bacterium]MBF0615983.1 response regulator [Nitrospirota bacterium]